MDFQVGDYVYLYDSEKAKQKHRKLNPQWSSPYQLLNSVHKDVFDVCSCHGRLLTGVHNDKMMRHYIIRSSLRKEACDDH